MDQEKNDFETMLKKLEEASRAIKSDDISIEEAIEQYEKGISYYNECSKILDKAQGKIETLIK